MTIANLSDLYVLFGAKSFVDLNRRIYKETSCGASISIYGTLPTSEANPKQRENAKDAYLRDLLMTEYERILPLLQVAYHRASKKDQTHISKTEDEFQHSLSKITAFVDWARSIVPGAFPVTDIAVPDRIPVAYHSGHYAPISASFLLTGFTIQTTVEGSDAEVNSDVFPLGTTKVKVDAWIEHMEREADRLRREADGEDENTEDDN
jgi:hypothetical protein